MNAITITNDKAIGYGTTTTVNGVPVDKITLIEISIGLGPIELRIHTLDGSVEKYTPQRLSVSMGS